MTALFAFANQDTAFIAGDSLRADPLGLFPPATVTKIHVWSDAVLFGQAGSSRLGALIAAMLASRSTVSADATGLVAAFQALRDAHHQAALTANRKIAALCQGTLLVAAAANVHVSAQLFTLNFATGAQQALPGPVAAYGTDPTLFSSSASKHHGALVAAASGGLALDQWAALCMADAIAAHPGLVGWPSDLIIAKGNAAGGRTVTIDRMAAPDEAARPAFAL
ncbi:hypothetical protein [Azospirillum agricola]|uniref:hypothetical protein n=1 Tax=Azospirillum agricola TaxID=1720247 RepID=UPI000A0EEEAA|nr:hypothetical protein [Azospirillum agricola]SMH61544.1 hypothetical protein SAMN02982994_5891 [Azospirillum lipoferum]